MENKRTIDTVCMMCSSVYVVQEEKWVQNKHYQGDRKNLSYGLCDNKVCYVSFEHYALGMTTSKRV